MMTDEIVKLKEDGNQHFKSSDYDAALNCYTQALKLCNKNDKDAEKLIAALYNNRSAVYLKRKDYKAAEQDANKSNTTLSLQMIFFPSLTYILSCSTICAMCCITLKRFVSKLTVFLTKVQQ